MKRSTLQPLRTSRPVTTRRYSRRLPVARAANPAVDLFSAIGLVWLAAADSFGRPLGATPARARAAAG